MLFFVFCFCFCLNSQWHKWTRAQQQNSQLIINSFAGQSKCSLSSRKVRGFGIRVSQSKSDSNPCNIRNACWTFACWCPSQDAVNLYRNNKNDLYPSSQAGLWIWTVFWACKHVLGRVFWQPHLPPHQNPLSSSWVCFIVLPCPLKGALKSQQWSWLCM